MATVYDGKWYVGKIESIGKTNFLINFEIFKGNVNQFLIEKGDKIDKLTIPSESILCPVEPPQPISNRFTGLEKKDLELVKAKFNLWKYNN